MDIAVLSTLVIVASLVFCFGLFFVIFAKQMKKKGHNLLGLSIIGWIMLTLSIVGYVILFILFIDLSGGEFATYLFLFISPIFFLIGTIICLSIGFSSLSNGYHKDKDGKRDTSKIVRGWALLILSILVIAAIIITLTILLTNYANMRNEHPVRMM